ncbi:MAG: hypothetical protein RLP44_26240 [Aggregatilineales bacterium]
MKISYHQNNEYIEKDDTTLPEILSIIASLNATDSNYIHIWKGAFRVSVMGGHLKRLLLLYSEEGMLLDPAYTENDGKVRMRVDDGTYDTHPINQTITREKAIEVAHFILEHDAPPKGSTWLSNGLIVSK